MAIGPRSVYTMHSVRYRGYRTSTTARMASSSSSNSSSAFSCGHIATAHVPAQEERHVPAGNAR
eukprot:942808-Rhodomonas_salina.1